MKVISGIGKIKKRFKYAVVAIGVFDGVHRGHQALIKRAVARAKFKKGESIVVTFSPHPVKVLNPEKYLPYIISLSYRIKLIEELGVDYCLIIKFTKQFSRMDPEEFIKKYIGDAIRTREIFVGDDFRFGKDRSGTLDFFKENGKKHGFKVNSVSTIKSKSGKIGSTSLRHLIAEGNLKEASVLLGRPVSLMGEVIKGDGRGKSLGYPTANLRLGEEVLPPVGVYAVYVYWKEKKYNGMVNIGYRPTFSKKNGPLNVEVHIFDFRRVLYGETVIVQFIKKIRDEKRFDLKESLIHQIQDDEKSARLILL